MLFKNFTIVDIFVHLHRNSNITQLECYSKITFRIQL